jgi:hypothetical protein
MQHNSVMTAVPNPSELRARVLSQIASDPDAVWTPADFSGLGTRAAVDKTLQRLAAAGELRRIDRGLYDRPRKNRLTGGQAVRTIGPSSALSLDATTHALSSMA